MKNCIYVVIICSVLLATALIFGGCGNGVEAEVLGAVEVAEPELLDFATDEQPLEPQAQETAGQPRQVFREVPRQDMFDAPTQDAPEQTVLGRPADMLPIDPTGVWGDALEEYLAQFLPIFHNARYEEWTWLSWWKSDGFDFIEWLPNISNTQSLDSEYGITFHFRNPMTSERILIDDVPFLTQRSGQSLWHDDRAWTRVFIAHRFNLYLLDETDIPVLIIRWALAPYYFYPGELITLHRFQDGEFVFVQDLSMWESVDFLRDEGGRLFIEYRTTVGPYVDLRLMHINEEITTEPALFAEGWGLVRNYFTGEEFYESCPDRRQLQSFETHDERLEYLLGIPLTRVEHLACITRQLMEQISARLRDEGLVG